MAAANSPGCEPIRSSASCGSVNDWLSAPSLASWRTRIAALRGLSSTTAIRRPLSRRAASACSPGSAVDQGNGIRHLKCDPLPDSLSTETEPPMASLSLRVIDSPRPVPPKRRVMLESSCMKGSKSLPRPLASIPTPVSITESSIRAEGPSIRALILTRTSPSLVNLIAFETRFSRI